MTQTPKANPELKARGGIGHLVVHLAEEALRPGKKYVRAKPFARWSRLLQNNKHVIPIFALEVILNYLYNKVLIK